MCLHEVQERLDRIALGTSSSSMLLLRVGGGEDSGGMVTCHAPPPMEEDEDVAGWSIIVASPAGGLWHAQPPLSPESTASALLIKAQHPVKDLQCSTIQAAQHILSCPYNLMLPAPLLKHLPAHILALPIACTPLC